MWMNPVVTTSDDILSENQIVVNSMPHKAVGCRVDVASANGTRIIRGVSVPICKKGTPLYGTIEDRSSLFTATAPTPGDPDDPAAIPAGVLIHDVPFYGTSPVEANGSLMIDGGIIKEFIDTDIQAIIEATPLVEPGSHIKYIGKFQ